MSSKFDEVQTAKTSKPKVFLNSVGRFPRALQALAEVSRIGCAKRNLPDGDMNFLDNPNTMSDMVREAEYRHSLRERINEIRDPASGMLIGPAYNPDPADGHMLEAAYSAWNALARLECLLAAGFPLVDPKETLRPGGTNLYDAREDNPITQRIFIPPKKS